MPHYSKTSQSRLNTCHKDIRTVFEVVIRSFDNTIVCGTRGRAEQEEALRTGKSKAAFGQSPHNYTPSMAVDAAPWDVVRRAIDWHDRERLSYFAGFVVQTSIILQAQGFINHRLRWGGDWDQDTEVEDNGFDDLVHFEIAGWEQLVKTQETKNA